jgi:alkylation response protein AidB-like acyl-CoA dehydrogenase
VTVDDTVSFPPIDETMGMRATRSRTILFDGTPLHRSRLVGPPSPESANLITVGFAFISIGIAEAALDALATSATGRSGLSDAGWVRSETAMAWTQLRAARLLAEQVAWLADQRSPEAMPAAVEAKLLANETAKSCAALAVRVGGGSGYLVRSPVQRIFRDAQAGALMAYSVPFSQELVAAQLFPAT